MAAVFQDSQAALEMALEPVLAAALTDVDGKVHVDWPSMGYEPSPGQPWARVRHLRGQTSPAGVGKDAPILHPGVMQVSLFFPFGRGDREMLQLAEAICVALTKGKHLTKNSTTVRVLGSWLGATAEEPGWVHGPVSVRWQVHETVLP